ncbi:hypothetical protein BN6_28550 [Saccharothrix espanaensis DSM 44229]|uniref:Fido domain-containing protein n=2 Tax=Saccharothrix espanaensis TaxID=103731 RepID=K0JZT9_SACES|nr:hypothetical protein BN6_28550 [Saccharothrix espanaensis DSM 44229]
MPYGEWVERSATDDSPEWMRGMRAYLPRPLASDFILPTETHRVQAMAEHTLGELNERTRGLPDHAMFELCTRLREVQSAAEMAGTSADFSESWMTSLLLTRAAEGVGEPEEVLLERAPMGRLLQAVEHGAQRLAGGGPFDAELLCEVGRKLAGGDPAEPGLRTGQSWLADRKGDQPRILTVPPGALLHSAFAQWSTWIDAPHSLPRVGKISLGHLHLALLDPHQGAGPYLTSIYDASAMVRAGLLRDQVLALSTWLDEHEQEYHAHIRAVVDGGPIEDWILFFAGAVRAQATEQLALIDKLNALRRSLVAQAKGSPTVQRVVSGLITAPVTSNRALETVYGMANRTATQVTRHLVQVGILEIVDGKSYNKVFVCQPVLDLYALQVPLAPESDRDAFAPPAD